MAGRADTLRPISAPSPPPISTPPPPPPPTCYRHPDRPTGRACTRCGRPACPECLVQAAVGSQCADCVRASRPPATERLRRWNAGQTAIMTKLIIAANVIVFVIGLSGGNVINGEGSVQIDLGLSAIPLRNGEWYRLITSGFTHAGILHLGL